jgi:nucleotide-binding universal stress UspA family protein
MSIIGNVRSPAMPLSLRPLGVPRRECGPLAGPVLLATDGSATSSGAMRVSAALARARHARVGVLSVVPSTSGPVRPFAGDATGPLGDAATCTLRADIDTTVGYVTGWPLQLATGAPAETICREAHYRTAGMIVLGLQHHDVLDRVFREETTLLVARRGSIPVLAVTPLLVDLPRRVVVAVDFSRGSLRAARAACSIVAEGGMLSLVHVQPEVDRRREELGGHHASYALGVVGALARLAGELRVPAGVTVDTVVLRGAPTRS